MTVRLADARDFATIRQHLADTPNPPRTTDDGIAAAIERGDVVMVDDATGVAVRLAPDANRASALPWVPRPGLGVVDIPWMLPRAKWNMDNVDQFPPVLKAALDELWRRMPETNEWPCGGEFEGEQVADPVLRVAKSVEIGTFWKARFFPDIMVVPYETVGVHIPLARAEAQTVRYLRERLAVIVAAPRVRGPR